MLTSLRAAYNRWRMRRAFDRVCRQALAFARTLDETAAKLKALSTLTKSTDPPREIS